MGMGIAGSCVRRTALWFSVMMVVLAILVGGVIAISSGSTAVDWTRFLSGFLGWTFVSVIILATTRGN